MCNDHKVVCSECGMTYSLTDRGIGFTCDECSAPLCERCYSNIPETLTKVPTATGISGFVKLCKHCQAKYKNQATTKTYIN